jgi:hypothetical protein
LQLVSHKLFGRETHHVSSGDALNHVVLNLESLFVMKIEPKTIAGAGLVPTD